MFNFLNKFLPAPLYVTFNLARLTPVTHHQRRTKTGILWAPRVRTVRFGNYSLAYRSVLSWNVLQNYLPFDNLSKKSLNKLKYFVTIYYILFPIFVYLGHISLLL